MKIIGVIPARFASTRFPGKPLADIGGMTMIQRVYNQAVKATQLAEVWVATDDERIANEVESFGGNCMLTRNDHLTGTDRIIEVMSKMPDADAFVNIQGDEPFIDPSQIDLVCEIFADRITACVGTLVKPTTDEADLTNANVVKVVTGADGRALYFSRSAIPHLRNEKDAEAWANERGYLKHVGIYAYSKAALQQIAQMKPGVLERAESLEQLRWLENGLPIFTKITELETVAVDTPADLERARAMLK
jgi:3-deoxy-manno-octulosonate cytidylyltransferase (CMP-KDO synthetase)